MHDVARSTHRGFLAGAGMLACLADVGPAWGATAAVERELKLVVSVEATQDWKKNDPQFPGEQWSKARAKNSGAVLSAFRPAMQVTFSAILGKRRRTAAVMIPSVPSEPMMRSLRS